MTPLQIAKEQCCNYREDACTGITINDNLIPRRFREEGLPCLLAENQRCEHFETCVIHSSAGFQSPAYAKAFTEAVDRYRRDWNIHRNTARRCPDCNQPLEPRRRYCPACSEKRVQASNRARSRKSGSHPT